MNLKRQIKYYYLRFIRLRGEPHELALGMAFGVFCGMMPIIPFQIAIAVTLAIFFKGSKITAALGTWVSNPFNWYFLYYISYKFGAFVLRFPEQKAVFSSLVVAIRSGEDTMALVGKIFGSGGTFISALLIGGAIIGVVSSIPSYFLFLWIFRNIRKWRRSKKESAL